MNRRRLLQRLGTGGMLFTAGCASVGEKPRPFDFAVVNRRERSYHVEFTLWNDADETVVDGAVDIAPRPPADEEYTRMSFDDIARVTNGDSIEARVRTAGETFEETYDVTCNRSGNAENTLVFSIRHPDAPDADGSGMEFRGSEC